MSRGTRAARTASSRASDLTTLSCQYSSGLTIDSPAAIRPAKCSTASNPASGVSTSAASRMSFSTKVASGATASRKPVTQIVQHDDLVAGVEQQAAGDAADVAGAPGDEQFHDVTFRTGRALCKNNFPPKTLTSQQFRTSDDHEAGV